MSEVDRSRLPIRRETFGGVVNRTLDGSEPDWNLIGHPDPARRRAERPAGPHRRRRIREPEHVRRSDPDAELHAARRTAVFATTASTSPRCARRRARRLLTGRNNHAVGFGSIGEFAGGFPGYSAISAPRLRAVAADPSRQRLQHGRVRQVAPDPRRSAGSGGAVRPVAERLGLRLLLRNSRRRFEPVGSVFWPRTRRSSGPTRGSTTRKIRTTSPMRWPTTRSSGCMAYARRTRTSRSSPTSRPGAVTRPTTLRRSGPTSTRGSSTRDGTGSGRRRSRVRRSSASFRQDAELTPRDDSVPGVGRHLRQAEGVLRPPDGGVRGVLGERGLQRRPRDRRDRRSWESSTTP